MDSLTVPAELANTSAPVVLKRSALFMPRKQEFLPGRLLDRAWQNRSREMLARPEALHAGAVVADWLESRFPAADMEVLARYGLAKPRQEIGVCTYSKASKLFNHSYRCTFPRPVMLPEHNRPTPYAGGQRFKDADGERGLHPGVWEAMDEAEREKLRKSWAGSIERRVPLEVEPYFLGLSEAHDAYNAECRTLGQLLHSGGRHRWGNLFDAFPAMMEIA